MSGNPFKSQYLAAPEGAARSPYDEAQEACADYEHVAGWTPADITPEWLALLCYALGVIARKFWVYVCAPIGAVFIFVLACIIGANLK